MLHLNVRKSILWNVPLVLFGMFVAILLQPNIIPVAVARVAPEPGRPDSSWNQAPASSWISCTPVSIVAYGSRVHVQCASAVGGISYFAASTADAANAARVLSVISTAQVAGRTLSILYDPSDTSGATFGCQASNCRIIQAVGFGQ